MSDDKPTIDRLPKLIRTRTPEIVERMFEWDEHLLAIWAKKFGGETTLNEMRVANVIVQHRDGPGLTNGQIAQYLDMPKATVSRATASLQDKGMVRLERDSEDARMWHLNVTETMRAPADERPGFYIWREVMFPEMASEFED